MSTAAAMCVQFQLHYSCSGTHTEMRTRMASPRQPNVVEFTNTRKPDCENKETREEEMTVIMSVIVISSIVYVKLVTFMVTCSVEEKDHMSPVTLTVPLLTIAGVYIVI